MLPNPKSLTSPSPGGSESGGGDFCPSQQDLLALCLGRLPEPASAVLLAHASHCPACESQIRQLSSSNDSLAKQIRQAAFAPPTELDAECLRLEEAARQIPARHAEQSADPTGDTTVSSRVSTHADADDPPAARPTTTEAFLPAIPERVGRYHLRSYLGGGSYGRVYLALDGNLDRLVALKIPRFTGPLAHSRMAEFLDEARAAARLHHPGIVTIYEAALDPLVGCYIAMEYVEGKTLKQRIAEGPIATEQAVGYVAQAAAAVHYAHKRGLVHRDLKPGNLLVTEDEVVKVTDFGLALAEEEQRDHAGEYAGTPLYMSPEQLRGEAHRLDGRTDVWSLGVILYESLARRRPFGGDQEEATDEILHRPPKPPRQINDKIPAELERICLKCLAKSPTERYSTAKDLAEDLARLVEPASRRGPWEMAAAAAVAAILLILIGGGLTSVVQRFYLSPVGSAAVEDRALAPQFQPPYNVDEVARPHEPYRLLVDRTPRELFPPDDPSEHWHTNQAREQLSIDTPSTFLVGLGETSSSSFQLKVEITKTAASGYAGFFLGYRAIPGREGWWQCEVICIRCDHGVDGDRCYLQRDVLEIEALPRNRFGINRTGVALVPAPNGVRQAMLEVTITAGRITQVRWRGAAFPELTKRTDSGLSSYVGGFGLVSTDGSATFDEPRFISLN